MGAGPCVPVVSQPGVVTFDPAVFVAIFPQFATVPAPALSFNFQRATLQLDNSCGSRIKDVGRRELYLNLLTAHITAISNGENGQPARGIVGRLSDATEGSVSASADYGANVSQSMAYYIQTRYGAEYWQATAYLRTGVYLPPPPSCCPDMLPLEGSGVGFGPMGNGNCGYNGGSA